MPIEQTSYSLGFNTLC